MSIIGRAIRPLFIPSPGGNVYLIQNGVLQVPWSSVATPYAQNGTAVAPSVLPGNGFIRVYLSQVKASGIYRTFSDIDLSNYQAIVFDVAAYATKANQKSYGNCCNSAARWFGPTNNSNYHVGQVEIMPNTTGSTTTITRQEFTIPLNTTKSACIGLGFYNNRSDADNQIDIYNCYLVPRT